MTAAAFVALGLALGGVYFVLLRASVRRLGHGRAWVPALARLALAGVGFWLVAQAGAVALVATLGGFLIARGLAARWLVP